MQGWISRVHVLEMKSIAQEQVVKQWDAASACRLKWILEVMLYNDNKKYITYINKASDKASTLEHLISREERS